MRKFVILILIGFIVSILNCGNGKKPESQKSGENTAPVIKNVMLLPETPVQGSRITIRIEAFDKEGNQIEYDIKWFLNDNLIGEGFEFFLDQAKRNDQIYALVTPFDNELSGETVKTKVLAIGNTPPKITSAKISPDTVLTSTGDLTVQAEGFDPDNDPLTWLCYWTLDYAKRIADSSLTISLEGLDIKKDSHLTAELYASDNDTVSTPYLIEIDVVNGHPILKKEIDSIPYTSDSIYFPVPIIDPDNDDMTFELLDAPYGLWIDKNKGIVTGKVEETSAFDILVKATDTDGAYLEARFTLTPP